VIVFGGWRGLINLGIVLWSLLCILILTVIYLKRELLFSILESILNKYILKKRRF